MSGPTIIIAPKALEVRVQALHEVNCVPGCKADPMLNQGWIEWAKRELIAEAKEANLRDKLKRDQGV